MQTQTQTQVIYPGSVLLTYIQSSSNPLEIFLILDFVPPKQTPCTPLDKSPLPNPYNSSYTEKNFSSTRKLSCTILSL